MSSWTTVADNVSSGEGLTPAELLSPRIELAHKQWQVFALFLLVLAGIVGNLLVCIAVCVEKKLQNVTNYFLMSLAMADLLVSLIVMPCCIMQEFMGIWPFGLVLCSVWQISDVTMCTSSIWHMCFISIDRYCSIRAPLKTRNRSCYMTAVKISAVWFVSLGIASPLVFIGYNHPTEILNEELQCGIFNANFLIWGSIVAFFVPLLIMLITYSLTIRLLSKRAKRLEERSKEGMRRTTRRKSSGAGKRQRKAAGASGTATESSTENELESAAKRKSRQLEKRNSLLLKKTSPTEVVVETTTDSRSSDSECLSATTTLTDEDSNKSSGSTSVSGSTTCPARRFKKSLRRVLLESDLIHCRKKHHATLERNGSCRNYLFSRSGTDPVGVKNAILRTQSAQTLPVSQPEVYCKHSCSVLKSSEENSDSTTTDDQGNDAMLSPLPHDVRGATQEGAATPPPLCDHCVRPSDRPMLRCHSEHADGSKSAPKTVPPICRSNSTVVSSKVPVAEAATRCSAASSLQQQRIKAKTARYYFKRRQNKFCSSKDDVIEPNPAPASPTTTSDNKSKRSGRNVQFFIGRRSLSESFRLRRMLTLNKTARTNTSIDSSRPASSTSSTDANSGTMSVLPRGTKTDDVPISCLRELDPTATTSEMTSSIRDRFQSLVRKHSAARLLTELLVSNRNDDRATLSSVKTERKAVRVLGAMFVLFVVSWASFFVMNITAGVCETCPINMFMFKCFLWLGYASSILNPIIYTIFNKAFKRTFVRLLSCAFCSNSSAGGSNGDSFMRGSFGGGYQSRKSVGYSASEETTNKHRISRCGNIDVQDETNL